MLTVAILEPILVLVRLLLDIIPNLPSLPDSISNGINSFLDIIFNNIGMLGIFVPISTIKIVIPLVIVIMNLDHIYKLSMFIIKKIPINME